MIGEWKADFVHPGGRTRARKRLRRPGGDGEQGHLNSRQCRPPGRTRGTKQRKFQWRVTGEIPALRPCVVRATNPPCLNALRATRGPDGLRPEATRTFAPQLAPVRIKPLNCICDLIRRY